MIFTSRISDMVFVSDPILNVVLLIYMVALVRFLPIVHVIYLTPATVNNYIIIVDLRFGRNNAHLEPVMFSCNLAGLANVSVKRPICAAET